MAVCMSDLHTVKDVIDLWPARKELASDLAPERVSVDMVHKWARFQSIPAKFHQAILDAALLRSFPLDAETLVRVHSIREDAA